MSWSGNSGFNRSVNSDEVHVKCHASIARPEVSVKILAYRKFSFRMLCSYYGNDTLKKNLLTKNTRVKQTIGVSIPSAHCSDDDQNCFKESESSVQEVEASKEDLDPTKFTTGNLPVCPDFNKDHLPSLRSRSIVKVVHEVNNRNSLKRDTNNVSVNGNVCETDLTFLVDTDANVTAIKADVWRQILPLTKHPTSQTAISYIKSVGEESSPVLRKS